jgi:hypothetical protein
MSDEKLYLDDFWGAPEGWTRVTTAPECIRMLQERDWERVSIDYDLDFPDGEIALTGTGMDVMEWIRERVMADPSYVPPAIQIHSTNVPARERLLAVAAEIEAELVRTGRVRPTPREHR